MFDPIFRRLRNWRLRNVTRRKLALLDDRLLAEMASKASSPANPIAEGDINA